MILMQETAINHISFPSFKTRKSTFFQITMEGKLKLKVVDSKNFWAVKHLVAASYTSHVKFAEKNLKKMRTEGQRDDFMITNIIEAD